MPVLVHVIGQAFPRVVCDGLVPVPRLLSTDAPSIFQFERGQHSARVWGI
jgi:hypothetical protein